jgi:phage/plasmid-associated DNA primase
MVHTVAPVDFEPDADTSEIERTVLAAMADDAEMAAYLQMLLGYGITGEVSEEELAIGDGRTGQRR